MIFVDALIPVSVAGFLGYDVLVTDVAIGLVDTFVFQLLAF